MLKNKSVKIPEQMEREIERSRANMAIDRGRVPSFTDWMLEAAAEKLKREEGKNDAKNRTV